jgi:hypothetical protein
VLEWRKGPCRVFKRFERGNNSTPTRIAVAPPLLGERAGAGDLHFHRTNWFSLATLLLALFSFPAPGDDQPAKATGAVRTVELRGRVVCIAEEMHRQHGAPLPTNHEHLWGLKAQDGRIYTLLRGKFSEAIFVDERIRKKDLAVKARLFPNTQVIELTRLRSVKAGLTQDIYYFCDVCVIESVSPESCSCCQGPVELIEKPLKDSTN